MGITASLKEPGALRADLAAGLSVALVLIPQAIAYAQLAGLPPLHGLYAAFLPVIVAALFGWSRHLQTGPTALVCLMTAAALGPLVAADTHEWIVYALTLAVLVGLFQLMFGLLRLGMLVNFLAAPVIAGFTSAAALIIATSQLGALLGLEQVRSGWHFTGVAAVLADIGDTHLPTLMISAFTLAVIVLVKRLAPRWAYMIALVAATLLAWLTGFAQDGGAVIGALPTGLPPWTLPAFSPDLIADLFLVAATIALIGFVETATVIRALSARSRQPLNLDREMIGQGLANLAAGLSQTHPVSGSLSRSHVGLEAGGRSGLTAVVAGLAVGVVLLAAAPLLAHLPRASLAVVIISAITMLVKFTPLRDAFRTRRSDGVTGVITFVLTLLVAPALHQSVLVGVLLSLGMFVFRSMRPRVATLGRHPDGSLRDAALFDLPPCDMITVIRFDGPLYFANAVHFEEHALAALADKDSLRFLVVDCGGVNEIDATGEQTLRRVYERLDQAGVTLLLCTVRSPVRDVIARTGLLEAIGRERIMRDADRAVEYAWERLEPGHKDECPLRIYPAGK